MKIENESLKIQNFFPKHKPTVSRYFISSIIKYKKYSYGKKENFINFIKLNIITNTCAKLLQKPNPSSFHFHDLRQPKVKSKTKILFSFLHKILYFPSDFYTIILKNIYSINEKVN